MSDSKLDLFKKQIELLEGFVTDPQWLTTLKFDYSLFQDVADELTMYIKQINNMQKSSENLECLIQELRKKCIFLVEKAKLQDDVVERWKCIRKAYARYAFIETITEGSVISDYILELFKKEYGSDYLSEIKELDNLNPSILTNFKDVVDVKSEYTESQKLYILMKKWQDDQHLFHNEYIYLEFSKAKKDFDKYFETKMPEYMNKCTSKARIMLIELDNMNIIEIDTLSKFIIGGVKKELAYVVGGKNLGLAILNSVGAKIPKTYAIPIGSLLKEKYVDELKKLDIEFFSVRSSATVEDNENQSFAGMFKSILNIDSNSLEKAIKEVCESVSSDRVDAYIKHFNTDKPYMSVVLQSFKEPEKAGVWIGKNLDFGHLEWIDGNGEKLVSGMVTPIYENFEEGIENDYFLKVGKTKVGDECKKLQKVLNSTADFEWCILNDELIWLQFRPVTKTFSLKEKNEIKENSDNIYYAIAASEGIVSGKPQYMEDVEESLFEEGNILLTDFTDPDWVPIILKSCGIITAEGGFLSHTAIISRELGIPCVTGIGSKALNVIKNNTKIVLNGTLGKVEVLN